jgi:pyrroloquinoline-quinone synthase
VSPRPGIDVRCYVQRMKNKLSDVLELSLSERRLLNHAFYQRWEAGELSFDELRHYAEQYRYFEEMLPLFLGELADVLLDGLSRDLVLKNLVDEVSAPSHLELFEDFAAFYEASDAPISLAMRRLVAAYFEVLAESPVAALAGLWAYESQGAEIADSKAEGLAQHYGANHVALAFWAAHGSVEGDHAKWTLESLEILDPDLAVVHNATRVIADAWWQFLDERELLAQ